MILVRSSFIKNVYYKAIPMFIFYMEYDTLFLYEQNIVWGGYMGRHGVGSTLDLCRL